MLILFKKCNIVSINIIKLQQVYIESLDNKRYLVYIYRFIFFNTLIKNILSDKFS